MGINYRSITLSLGMLLIGAATSIAGSIKFNLDCTLNTTPCTPTSNFGSITLDDSIGGGKITVTVDLAGTGQKFRDLLLNYSGAASITNDGDAGNTVSISSDGFSMSPYTPKFDIGGGGGKGWEGLDLYSTTLTGSAPLLLSDFNVKDSSGSSGVYAAIHIQNIGSSTGGDCDGSGTKPACNPGQTGPGSLKIGASSSDSGTPKVPDGGTTLGLLGCALAGLGVLSRKFSV